MMKGKNLEGSGSGLTEVLVPSGDSNPEPAQYERRTSRYASTAESRAGPRVNADDGDEQQCIEVVWQSEGVMRRRTLRTNWTQ
jgi:hypothetical protein